MCTRECASPTFLLLHMRHHYNQPPLAPASALIESSGFEYECSVCQQTFQSFNGGKIHLKIAHPELKTKNALISRKIGQKNLVGPQVMQMVNSPIKNMDDLYKYMETVLPNRDNRFLCPECPLSYSEKKSLRYHLQKHYNILPIKCSICDKGFVKEYDLKIHAKSHKPVECDICFAQFDDKNSLHFHKKSKHSIKKKTQKCSKLNEMLDYCKSVQPTATGLFSCNKCRAELQDRCELESHLKLHYEFQLFQCDECLKNFSTLYNLKRHQTEKRHSNKDQVDIDSSSDYSTSDDDGDEAPKVQPQINIETIQISDLDISSDSSE